MVNKNFLKEKWLYPQTEPDQQGRTRKLGIELNEFNGDVELMKFHYSFGKGEGLYFTAGYTVCLDIFETLRTVMQKPEKVVFKWEDAKGKKAPVSLHVGRDENLTPFFALSGEIPGVGARQKKFYFTYPKGYRVFRNGQLVSDLELAERQLRAFLKNADVFLEDFRDNYKPREFNNAGGGSYGRGGYNNGGNGGGYNNQSGAKAPTPTNDFDDII